MVSKTPKTITLFSFQNVDYTVPGAVVATEKASLIDSVIVYLQLCTHLIIPAGARGSGTTVKWV